MGETGNAIWDGLPPTSFAMDNNTTGYKEIKSDRPLDIYKVKG